jgi:MoxR-like ATPase
MFAEMIALQVCLLARVAVFLWGEPGIGKTATTTAMAEVLSEMMWTVILSIREPSDQGGLPVIRPDGSVWMAPPGWAKELEKEGHGIVYLDELNVAPPTTQNSALRVVQEGQAGDQKLPDETSFVAAGNPPETNVGAYNLTAAMANRFVHINWPLNYEAWCNGMISGWTVPPTIKLHPRWKMKIAEKRGFVSNFISARGGELLHAKPDDPGAQGKAWPSPRMWTTWATLWAACESAGHDVESEVARVLCAGCVGEAAATEFFTWIVNLDLRQPEEYLADPLGVPLPTRQDQIMATLSAVAAACLSREGHARPAQIKRYRSAWRVMGRILKSTADVAIPAARILAVNMPTEIEKDLPPEIEEILPILEEAEIDFSVAV